MRRARLSGWDIIAILILLSVIFTVLLHLSVSQEREALTEALIKVKIERQGGLADTASGMVSGAFRLVGEEGGFAFFECRGYDTEAGFLPLGEKYIFLNMPFNFSADGIEINGKIYEIRKMKSG